MAGWWQAVALAMTGEEIEALTALSRSRTEPAGRVSRAAMLLGYREKPSFFAVDEDLACMIRRCSAASSERWPMARLRQLMTDRDRQRAAITPEAKAGVTLACDKAKEHGYPHELWTTRLLARHRASADRRQVTNVSPVWLKAQCASFSVKRKSSRTRCATIGTPRRRVRAQDGGSSVCLPRGPGPEKSRCQGGEIEEAGRDRLLRREAGIQAIATMHRICRQCQAAMRASRGTMSTNAMARSACWPGSICSPARSTRSSGSATAAASSSNSSSFSMPPIRPAPRSS